MIYTRRIRLNVLYRISAIRSFTNKTEGGYDDEPLRSSVYAARFFDEFRNIIINVMRTRWYTHVHTFLGNVRRRERYKN